MALVFGLLSFLPPVGVAQTPCSLVLNPSVAWDYQPSGGFYALANSLDWPASGDNPRIDADDQFNFTTCGQAPSSPISQAVGQNRHMPDPTILQVGAWFYITGTGDEDGLANFRIYRTQDFRNFEPHMLAFGRVDQGVRSGQWIDTATSPWQLHLNSGRRYQNLWAPQLYKDPSLGDSDPWIFLTFTSEELHGSEASRSIQLVRIRQSKFLQWHGRDFWTADGPRFADVRDGYGYQAWYGYTPGNGVAPPWRYDGGWAEGPLIPSTLSPNLLGPSCGQLERRVFWDPVTGVLRQHHFQHRCVGSATGLLIDPFVFIDPKLANHDLWKRVMLYVWDSRGGHSPSSPGATFHRGWGNHVAGAPLRSSQFEFDANGTVLPMAHARNTNNPIWVSGPGGAHWADNGTVDRYGQESRYGSTAEGATAIYLPQTDRYYLIYSRNNWDSPAYQLVYRMTEPGQPFTTIQSNFGNQSVPEHVLLRSNDPARSRGVSFGHAEAFSITRCDGSEWPFLIFHAKMDGSERRTVFFKELSIADFTTGELRRLYESHSNPLQDVRLFRVPSCILPR
ncbi:MAG: hypothetical protein AAGC60_15720 [Acidobacteriota bacterium]